jgi:hypothetical protein
MPGGFRYADDYVVMPLQCATQWDALSHVFYDDQLYNGFPASDITPRGALHNSIDKQGNGISGRGVLLDIAALKGVPWLEGGTAITPDDLGAAIERQGGVDVGSGDVLLFRTGWRRFFVERRPRRIARPSGSRFRVLRMAVRARRGGGLRQPRLVSGEQPGVLMPLHMVLIRDMGMSLACSTSKRSPRTVADGVGVPVLRPVLKVSRAACPRSNSGPEVANGAVPHRFCDQDAGILRDRQFVPVVLRLLGTPGGKTIVHKDTGVFPASWEIHPVLPGGLRCQSSVHQARDRADGGVRRHRRPRPMSVSSAATKTAAAPEISVKSFTSDFAAMKGLKSLAAKGKGKVVALLPDTQSSQRYVQYDEPFLKQAFAAAGLSSDDYQVQNAQGSASTMQTQAEAAITNGASVLTSTRSTPGMRHRAERVIQGRQEHRLRPPHPQGFCQLLRELRQRDGRQGHRHGLRELRERVGREEARSAGHGRRRHRKQREPGQQGLHPAAGAG